MRTMFRGATVAVLVSLAAVDACRNSASPADPVVQFHVDAPFCGGSRFDYEFTIDRMVVGTEQLVDKQVSRVYRTTTGSHVIGWNLRGNPTKHDSTVTLGDG